MCERHINTQSTQLTSDMSIARFVQSPLSFTLSTDKISYDHNVTVSWAIPEDEATHMDWVGESCMQCMARHSTMIVYRDLSVAPAVMKFMIKSFLRRYSREPILPMF